MLRITVQDKSTQVIIKLEGSLVGAWVMELEQVWKATRSSVASRSLLLDLTAVDQIDRAGKYLLALLCDRRVRLVASGLVMTEIVAEIVEEWHLKNA